MGVKSNTMGPRYHVIAKPGCGFCDKVLNLLEAESLPYDISTHVSSADAQGTLIRIIGRSFKFATFPQVIEIAEDGTTRLLGGYDQTHDALVEPLLRHNPDRFSLFPIKYNGIWDQYKRAVASFWTAEEISLVQDVTEYNTVLSETERHFVKHVLAFFAGSDGIVAENLTSNFATEVQIPEARAFYAYQTFNESIHGEVYSLFIDALIKDPHERETLLSAVRTVPCVRDKAAWALQWLSPSRRFAERLIAYVCVEGISFSGSFCAIYWLKTRGIMPGLATANQFISRDEGTHQRFGTAMYRLLKNPLSQAHVEEIIRGCVEVEKKFITEALPVNLIGMNCSMMSEYIEFVADRILVDLGYAKAYNASMPFDFMELISLSGKDNFFERFPTEYARTGMVSADREQQVFATDDDF